MTTLLRTCRLSSGYTRVPVTHDICISVDAGEIVALLGPNGAGKTATLLTISSVLSALDGTIDLFGRRVTRRGTRAQDLVRAGLAHVAQERCLFSDLTVRENLTICWGADRHAVDDTVRHFPPLEPLLGRKAGLLSGGEQQMLALARGFLTRPKLLLVDEPSLGLAPIVVKQLLPRLRDLADTTGAGVLLVEQHLDLALATADRGYVIANGRVVAEGSSDDLRSRRGELAATYMGTVGAPTAGSSGHDVLEPAEPSEQACSADSQNGSRPPRTNEARDGAPGAAATEKRSDR